MGPIYIINVPNTIRRIVALYNGMGLWNSEDRISIRETTAKIFHIICFVSFVLSMAIGASLTNEKDEFVFLTVLTIACSVHTFRMLFIIARKDKIITLIDQIGNHATNDNRDHIQASNKLKNVMKFLNAFIVICIFLVAMVVIYPIISRGDIIINIAFPWENNRTAFFIKCAFISLGAIYAMLYTLLSVIIWYLMTSGSIKYVMLGNQLRNMGVIRTMNLKVEKEPTRFQLFLQDLIEAIKAHQRIIVIIEDFSSTFSTLFFIQIFTSSLSICGSVFVLAFNSHENLLQDGIYLLTLLYNLFDILVVMYLGNEIELSSGQISYCLFESNWIEQTYTCKMYILILTEILKKPHELIIGQLYPLNLGTLMSIVKGAYSMFNVLQNANLRNR